MMISARPINSVRVLAATVMFGAAVATQPSLAQQAAPFSRIHLAVSVSQDVNAAEFQTRWDTSPALDVSAGFPFYVGEVRAAMRLIRAHSPEFTDMNSAFFHVAWGPSFAVGRRSSVDLSLAAGSMYMSFPDEPIHFRRSESELAVGLRAGATTRVLGPVHLQVWGEWQHAFTSIPVDFLLISAGLRYDLPSPDWLRRFLD